MEAYFLDKPKFNRLYNCSLYDIDQIPIEERAHPFWGTFMLIGYVFFMVSQPFLKHVYTSFGVGRFGSRGA
jgi:hypothetical protein